MRTSTVVYTIFSYGPSSQPSRLISAIRNLSADSIVVVHHDPSIEPFAASFYNDPNVVQVPHPKPCIWGDSSFLHAILQTLKWIHENLDYSWVVLLSGQDYPVTPLSSFDHYLNSSNADAFVYYFLADDPNHWPAGTALTRYSFYYLDLPQNPYYWRVPQKLQNMLSITRKAINANSSVVRLFRSHRNRPPRIGFRRLRSPFSKDFQCYGGYWPMDLSRRAVGRVLDFVTDEPKVLSHYQRTLIPEESYLQTALGNDPELRLVNQLNRFINWPATKNPASPSFITEDRLVHVFESGKPFARKFNLVESGRALDIIDKQLGLLNQSS